MYTHILLGYKEFNKDYVSHIKTENKIKIKYSLANKIKYLGNSNLFVPIDNKEKLNDVIKNISRERINNIEYYL